MRFSIVVPVHNAAAYLPRLLASLEAQAPGDYSLECVFIDDGSADESARIIRDWIETSPLSCTLISQENSGVGHTRNRGIEAATGDWIGFPDSDDFLGERYFSSIAKALREQGEDVQFVSANVVRYVEADDRYFHDHPLSFKFTQGTIRTDLDQQPHWIQSQAASGLFRREIIEGFGLRFITDFHAAEDALFVADYLLTAGGTSMLCVPDAHYFYRKRAAGDSAVDQYRDNRGFYFDRFESGYLPLLKKAAGDGDVPDWLANLVLYDLRWFFPREMFIDTKATHLSEDEKRRILELVTDILRRIDTRQILDYRVTRLPIEIHYLMLALRNGEVPTTGSARIVESTPRHTEIRYLFTGEPPSELVTDGTAPVAPLASKTRRLDYFSQRVLKERIIRVPAHDRLVLSVDGQERSLVDGSYTLTASDGSPAAEPPLSSAATSSTPSSLGGRLAARLLAEAACWAPGRFVNTPHHQRGLTLRENRHTAFVRTMAARRKHASRYREAWVFMDSIHAAGDSAEFLYWHVIRQEPQANAWFVLREDSPDWARLADRGARLVAYGSLQHKYLLIHARVVFSTHLDVEVAEPLPLRYYGDGVGRPWHYVYLQHGVGQHDLSTWFNRKRIDLLTTATPDEHEAIVGDGSPYLLTSDSVELTGFPRHDVLREQASGVAEKDRDILLFAPTWRHNLLAMPAHRGARRMLKKPIEQTRFGEEWIGLLNSPRLHELARRAGLRLVFLPHPNFRSQFPVRLLSEEVTLLTSVDDLNALLARCRGMVTDYSSLFFEAAIVGASISYFQFDRDEYLHGGHTQAPGYWSYEEHGFGPVALTIDEELAALERQFGGDEQPDAELFRERVRRTLPLVDGRSCERIIAAARSHGLI